MDVELSNSIRPGNAQKDFQGQSAWKCFSYKGISRVDAELSNSIRLGNAQKDFQGQSA